MWPFSKSKTPSDDWLTESQAKEVKKVFYRDHDVNCWYACAVIPNQDDVRVAAGSKEAAREQAGSLAKEVLLKSGRVVEVREE